MVDCESDRIIICSYRDFSWCECTEIEFMTSERVDILPETPGQQDDLVCMCVHVCLAMALYQRGQLSWCELLICIDNRVQMCIIYVAHVLTGEPNVLTNLTYSRYL